MSKCDKEITSEIMQIKFQFISLEMKEEKRNDDGKLSILLENRDKMCMHNVQI